MKNPRYLENIPPELIRQVLRLAPLAVIGTLVNSIILAAALWKSISHRSLVIWLMASLSLVIQRSVFLLKYRPTLLSPDQAAPVAKRFIAGLALAGGVWGCVAIFLFPVNSPTHQVLIVLVLCGMIAGAAEAFASVLPAFIAFAYPALAPLLIRFITIGGPVYLGMAGVTLLYMVLTTIIAVRVNVTNRKLVELKEHFAQIADERAAINARLQEEISERLRIENSLRNFEEELKLRSSQLLSAQEEERKRIALELHDSIGASLSAAKFSMENVVYQIEKGTADLEPVNYSITIIKSAIDDVRRIIMDLRPSILDDYGIIVTLNWCYKQFQTVYSNISIDMKIEIEENEIPERLKIIILRIAQEALHNIAKYSGAEWVDISISRVENSMLLRIHDHGHGFDLNSFNKDQASAKGFGIIGMKERTELSGGVFLIRSEIGEGTLVQASWPLPPNNYTD
jgi:signal transduction histidine kinase